MRSFKIVYFLVLLIATPILSYAGISSQDQVTVRGSVSSAEGEKLVGVSVTLVGTSNSTTTDAEGNYSINVPKDGVLSFTYVGFLPQRIPVNGQEIINVVLAEDTKALEEVVVTALGIQRQTRSLTYSTQGVDTEQLSKAPEPNIMNSLSGKVAGLSINSSGAGVGAPTRVVLRGNRSISGDSQPLYVVDGVPVRGNPQDFSSDNIASINVLKGPNAAALYGSAAQDGVIVIETIKGKAGKTNVSLSSTYMMTSPDIPIQFQNEFGQGTGGDYLPHAEGAWGAKLEGQMGEHWSRREELAGSEYSLLPQPNNKLDVFQNGHNLANNVLISMGSEKTQTAFSYTHTNARGNLPGNDLTRHNISIKVNNQLTPKLKLVSKIEYINQTIDNKVVEGAANFNPVMQAYSLPPNIRTEDARNFEFTSPEGLNLQDYWNPSSTLGANPYWTLYRNLNINDRERTLVMASLSYQFTDDLSFMVRGGYDGANTGYEQRLYNDTFVRAPNGKFSVRKGQEMEWNGDFLLSYKKQLESDWNISANIGGSTKALRNSSMSSNTGSALLVPNFFAISNTSNVVSSYSQGSNMNVNSLYAFAQVGWKNALFLDITGRNDWSSTLPADSRSYFYPSVGASAILSDLVDMPAIISFAKLRASWAQVGNSARPYMLSRTATFQSGGRGGMVAISPTLPNEQLLPEMTTSTELGLEVRLLDNRLGLDLTAYKTNTFNQLFTVAVPVGSGASQYYTNGGDVENKGLEILLKTTPVRNSMFRWDLDFNFGLNRSMVNEISDERPRVIVGGDSFVRDFVVEQGRPYGEIYAKGWERDDQGRVIVGANGMPRITSGRTVRVANFNPDWMGGILTSIAYKNFNLSALIEHRQGGDLVSMTNAVLFAQGLTEHTLKGRENGLVFGQDVFANETAVLEGGTPNTIAVGAETFWNGVGGRSAPVGEAFVESATNTRLRELTLGYAFQIKHAKIPQVHLSLVGRNLFFFHRVSDSVEPDLMQGVSPESEGFQSFAPPTPRTFGVNLKIDF